MSVSTPCQRTVPSGVPGGQRVAAHPLRGAIRRANRAVEFPGLERRVANGQSRPRGPATATADRPWRRSVRASPMQRLRRAPEEAAGAFAHEREPLRAVGADFEPVDHARHGGDDLGKAPFAEGGLAAAACSLRASSVWAAREGRAHAMHFEALHHGEQGTRGGGRQPEAPRRMDDPRAQAASRCVSAQVTPAMTATVATVASVAPTGPSTSQ